MSSSLLASTPSDGLPTASIIAIALGSAALMVVMVTCGTVIYMLCQRASDPGSQPPALETVHEASNQSPIHENSNNPIASSKSSIQQKEPLYMSLSTNLPALPEDAYMAYSRVKLNREPSHRAPVYELNSPGPSETSPISCTIWQPRLARDDELHMFEGSNRMGTQTTRRA